MGGVKNRTSCHAGMKNIVIGPDGKVYACLTGAYYKEDSREKFCMGDLSNNSLDEILLDDKKRGDVFRNAVNRCCGCTNPCELAREVYLFGMNKNIEEQELQTAFELEQERRIGDALLDYDGWHSIEKHKASHDFCWSSEPEARIFIKNSGKKITILYRKITSDLVVKIFLDGIEVYLDLSNEIEHRVTFDAALGKRYSTITFLADCLKSPKEIYGTQDTRYLGIGLEDVLIQ